MDSETTRSHEVKLHVYDLSRGLAKQMSSLFLGKQIDGIWHTGIVVFGREYFFGGEGIQSCLPGQLPVLGIPDSVVDLGITEVPYIVYLEYLQELGDDAFCPEAYHLFDHNCNTFSKEVAQFLTGKSIPSHITELPKTVLQTPLGQSLKPFLDILHVRGSPNHQGNNNNSQATESGHPQTGMKGGDSEEAAAAAGAHQVGKEAKTQSYDFHPSTVVLFKDLNVSSALAGLGKEITELKSKLASSELETLENLRSYLLDSASFRHPFPPEFLAIFDKLFNLSEGSLSLKLQLLLVMQAVSLKSDAIAIMKTNTKVMSAIEKCQEIVEEVHEASLRMLCNVCGSKKGFDWLINDSSWDEATTGAPRCNVKVVCKTVVAALVSSVDSLCASAAILTYNISQYEVNDDVAVELGSAILQCLAACISSEPTAYYCLSALYQFMRYGEVTCLTNVIGLDKQHYSQISDRIMQLCLEISDISKD